MNKLSRRELIKIYKKLHDRFGPQGWWPADTPFEMMVGAILTQNTAWSNVEKAVRNLKKRRALFPHVLRRIDRRKLASLIKPAGYYNVKAKRLKNFINFLSSEYGLSIKKMSGRPTGELREKLLAVNGIGPETCDSILLYAFGRPVFVIDAYTRRVFSKHGLIERYADYEEAQSFFMDNLPHEPGLFNEYHALIVRLAKEFCRTKPVCGNCPIYGKKLPCK